MVELTELARIACCVVLPDVHMLRSYNASAWCPVGSLTVHFLILCGSPAHVR